MTLITLRVRAIYTLDRSALAGSVAVGWTSVGAMDSGVMDSGNPDLDALSAHSATDQRPSEKLVARLQELRESYSPRSIRTDDGWQALEVQVRSAGASVKTRTG